MTKKIVDPEQYLLSALERAGETRFIPANQIRLLQDGPEVFSAWFEAIETAKDSIYLENYIFHQDMIGTKLLQALIRKVKMGVQVFVLYDWVGSLGTSPSFFQQLIQAGGQVRTFNPFRLGNPLAGIQRDHSKLLCVDERIGFVGGLCVGDAFAGNPELQIPPWRDTAVRIEGPAGIMLSRLFRQIWALCGPPLPDVPLAQTALDSQIDQGAMVQVIRAIPSRSRFYRQFHLLLSLATSRIWITDAYFVLPPTLYEALLAAAREGIDVRVLVPRHSDIPVISWLSRSGYGSLLSAGVRIFEWEGPMLHAKTSVIDGLWSRIGSSNMNLASLFVMWELDVVIKDQNFATQMEESFLSDLQNSSELVYQRKLSNPIRRQMYHEHRLEEQADADFVEIQEHEMEESGEVAEGEHKLAKARQQRNQQTRAMVARAGATVLGIAFRRPFQRSAWSTSTMIAIILLSVGFLGFWYPSLVGIPITLLLLWFGFSFFLQAISRGKEKLRHAKEDE